MADHHDYDISTGSKDPCQLMKCYGVVNYFKYLVIYFVIELASQLISMFLSRENLGFIIRLAGLELSIHKKESTYLVL